VDLKQITMTSITNGAASLLDLVQSQMPSDEDVLKVKDLMLEQVNGLPFRNVTCITTHCMSEVGACLVDSVCRDNF